MFWIAAQIIAQHYMVKARQAEANNLSPGNGPQPFATIAADIITPTKTRAGDRFLIKPRVYCETPCPAHSGETNAPGKGSDQGLAALSLS